jgi:hypothetical protein
MISKKTIWALFLLSASTQAFAQDPNAQKFAAEINVKDILKSI